MTTPAKIAVATEAGLQNAEHIATACLETGVPFAWGCALIEQESGGRSVYGHDVGGALSGFELEVNRGNYEVFLWMIRNGHRSNGVGPAQITYAPYHLEQDDTDEYRLWVPLDNIRLGLRILAQYRPRVGSWHKAAGAYNGGPSAPNMTYADEVRGKARAWRRRFRGAGA